VNNYFVYGPKGSNPWFQVDKNQSIYASGNMIDTDRDGKLNGGPSSIYYYQGVGEELAKPWSELTTSGPMLTAASAWRYVNSQSGVLPYDDIDSLIWHQVGTLGKEGALVKSVGAMGIKTNNGWGEVIAGEAAADSDKDGMPDYFEDAMGYDKSKDDAMTKESDGYVRIEKYINWLGASHMRIADETSHDFDLRTITRGFKDVSPTYSVSAAENGTVELAGDGYTARFAPKANFSGLASFKYTVKGNDNTEYTGRVEVLVEKSDIAADTTAQDSINTDTTTQDSSITRLADRYRLRADAVTVGVFDMNGHYMGMTTRGLPQGRYIVRQKVNGRILNKPIRKD
jgi:hypothetical protein